MKSLYFASLNRGKTVEMRALLAGVVEILDLNALGLAIHWEENGKSFQENAAIKARAVQAAIAGPVFADDSGLCVAALDGAPGIYSARWAGEGADDAANNQKLLQALRAVPAHKRQAYFQCSVVYKNAEGDEYAFEGRLRGRILEKLRGSDGFGYDPLFVPDGFSQTLAEMTLQEKNRMSHRALAIGEFRNFLASVKLKN